jgi:ferredoxin-NADP reductase
MVASRLIDAAKRKLPQRIFVFYSNRRPEDAPFLDELVALEAANPNYKLVATMTVLRRASWT